MELVSNGVFEARNISLSALHAADRSAHKALAQSSRSGRG
jgi:hypothetical protein